MSENKGIAGIFAQAIDLDQATKDHMTQYARHEANRLRRLNESEEGLCALPFKTLAELEAFIDERVRKVLEDDAHQIRASVAFQPTTTRKQAGICYACLHAGDDMERFEQGGQGVWIHKNDECRQRAVMIAAHGEHKG